MKNLSIGLMLTSGLVSSTLFAGGLGCHGGMCGGMCHMALCAGIWWVVSSLLVFVLWNHVATHLFNVKSAKFWHAFVFTAVCAAFGFNCCGKMGGCGMKDKGRMGCHGCPDKAADMHEGHDNKEADHLEPSAE